MNEARFTHLDLCSGTGAFSIGFEREGFETIGFAEIDPYCCALLKQNWPSVTNYGDVRNVPAVQCSVITAGDPCQPFSSLGLRRGSDDDRYLWPAVLANVEASQPHFFLGENVVGIANLVLSRRIDDLEARGYQCEAFDIPSCAVGLPSVERHIWLVATRHKERLQRHQESRISRMWMEQAGEYKRQAAYLRERSNNFEPKLRRSLKGFYRGRNRIAAIGNAAPPPIAQIFARAIRSTLTDLNE